MAQITASAVKELRERSGAGMMDCKKALSDTDGDLEAAVDLLRTKGLAAAQKKSSRTAAEGLIGVAVEEMTGAVVEVNSETDFVAKNERFQDFVRAASKLALTTGDDLDALNGASYQGGGTVAERLVDNVATIGENQQLRRVKQLRVEQGIVVPYVHNSVAAGLGKIGVLVALESDAGVDVLEPLGKQIAMHIAAAVPLARTADDLDPQLIERERGIATEKAKESGKPEAVQQKMVDGAVAKFAKDNALMSQLLVMDNKTPIADVIAGAAKQADTAIELTDYVRFQLGEGIERQEQDFAAEVAATLGN